MQSAASQPHGEGNLSVIDISIVEREKEKRERKGFRDRGEIDRCIVSFAHSARRDEDDIQ